MDEAVDMILEFGSAEHPSIAFHDEWLVRRLIVEGRPETPAEMFAPLNMYVEHAWFDRVRVVQEVAPTREALLYCGDRHLPWRRSDKVHELVIVS
jgi:hypothetical protein